MSTKIKLRPHRVPGHLLGRLSDAWFGVREVAPNGTWDRVRAGFAVLDRNLGRILGVGVAVLLLTLLVIGQVNHMTRTDTAGAATSTPAVTAAPPVPSARPAAPAPAIPAKAPAPAPAIPATAPVPAPAKPAAPANAPRPATHRVLVGDTLAGIGLRYGVGYRQIAAENGISDPRRITPGQRLAISTAAEGTVMIAPGDTLGGHSRRAGLTVERVLELNPHIEDPDRIVAGDQLRLRP
jgi:LysM repeat protein